MRKTYGPILQSAVLAISLLVVTLAAYEAQAEEAQVIDNETLATEESPDQVFFDLERYVGSLHVTPESEALVEEIFAAGPEIVGKAVARTRDAMPANKLSDPEINGVFNNMFRDEVQIAAERVQPQAATQWPFVPNRMERALCAAFGGVICATVALDAVEAWHHVVNQSHGDRTYGCGDAVRHAYWSALMAFDLLPWIAEQFGNAHEWGSNPQSLDTRMDLHNNSVGRYHGARALLRSSVHRGVHQSLDDTNGRPLWYIARGRDGHTYIYPSGPWCH
jgi:hypothetical protein